MILLRISMTWWFVIIEIYKNDEWIDNNDNSDNNDDNNNNKKNKRPVSYDK